MVKKKLVSMLVSMTMLVGMFPMMMVSAEGEEQIDSFSAIQAKIDGDGTNVAVNLTGDCVADQDDTCIVIPGNKNVAIFLNGYTIDRNLKNAEGPSVDGHVIKVEAGGSLTINPNPNQKDGTITGGYAENGGGIYVEHGGFLIMHSGSISANRASENGGAIYFEGGQSDANLNAIRFYGGSITNNLAERGGGIYVEAGADPLNLNDGPDGGAKLSGNRATTEGGGMYVNGTVNVSRVAVQSNRADIHGGGIYLGQYGHFVVKGKAIVNNNMAGSNDNLISEDIYLPTGKTVDISSLLSGSSIGIAVEKATSGVIVTTGYGNVSSAGDPSEYFFSNNSELQIALDEQSSEVVLQPAGGQEEAISFAGSSLTLDDGQIGLNVFVDLGKFSDNEDIITAAKVQFDVPGRGAKTVIDECDVNHKVVINGKVYYKFTCYLSSLQMAEEVKTRFIFDVDYIEDTFSIKRYILSYMNSEASALMGTNPYEDKLVSALASYGHYLQPYLSELNGWTVGDDGYAEMDNIKNTTYSEAYVQYIKDKQLSQYQAKINSAEGIKNISFKLELTSTNALIVTFTPDESTEKLSVKSTIDGKTYKAYKQDNGTYVMRISGIKIQDMADAIEIKGIAGDEGTEENVNVEITPIGYVYYALNNSKSGQKKINAMSALYEYWLYAYSYANLMSQ